MAATATVEISRGGDEIPISVPGELSVGVSFFIPCYNEEVHVCGAIAKCHEASVALGLDYEILVFDDCSRDRTADVVVEYRSKHPDVQVRLFRNKRNLGVARNFFEGAFQARGRYYRMVCGDDIEPLDTHVAMLRRLGEADIIIPYFTRIEGRRMSRHCLSAAYTLFVNIASGNHVRYYNGCPLYRRADVVRFHVETTGFGYQAEFLTRLLAEGRSFIEVPLVARDREGSESVNLRNLLSVGHSLLKIALRRLRVYLFK